jgi:acyl carrier protein
MIGAAAWFGWSFAKIDPTAPSMRYCSFQFKMSYTQTVIHVAQNLKLLDETGKLVVLDSLSMLDLITDLETATQLAIPTVEIRDEVFRSIEDVAQLLARLAAGQPSPP